MSKNPRTVTKQDIDRLIQQLGELPESPRQISVGLALVQLRPTLLVLKGKGYTNAQIALEVAQRGLRVSERAIARTLATSRVPRTAKRGAPATRVVSGPALGSVR